MSPANPNTARYERNAAGWKEIAHSPDLLAVCLRVAQRGKDYAESIAPVRTGDYKDHFEVNATLTTFPRFGERVSAELSNDSDHAVPLEFGTEPSITAGEYRAGMKAQHIVGRTADYLGGSAL